MEDRKNEPGPDKAQSEKIILEYFVKWAWIRLRRMSRTWNSFKSFRRLRSKTHIVKNLHQPIFSKNLYLQLLVKPGKIYLLSFAFNIDVLSLFLWFSVRFLKRQNYLSQQMPRSLSSFPSQEANLLPQNLSYWVMNGL